MALVTKNKKTSNINAALASLPIDVLVMAGGKGERLLPLTLEKPKPLLPIGNKPIIDYCMDRLIHFGVHNFWISVNYLGEQIEKHVKNGTKKNIKIEIIKETKPLGTIGAISKITNFKNDTVLIINSDILTAINYEDFYWHFIQSNADFSAISIPYKVQIPYTVFSTEGNKIIQFEEKPTQTFFSNGGIYLVKKELISLIPKETEYNATDFMELLLKLNKNVIYFPVYDYWLDIGRHEDYQKAQEDIKHLNL